MRNLLLALAATLVCCCLSVAQQAPPAEGTGLGEPHTATNQNASGTPAVSPNQNQAITGTMGSSKGTSNEPGFSGSTGAQTGSQMNSQGTAAASSSSAATDARRRTAARRSTAKGQAHSPSMQQGKDQQSSSSGGSGDKLLAPNMGPSTTEAPGPSTGNNTGQKPPRQ